MEELLNLIKNQYPNKEIIVMGDININLLNKIDTQTRNYQIMMETFRLKIKYDIPTRETLTTKIEEKINEFFPLKQIRKKNENGLQWYNKDIYKIRKERDRQYRVHKRSNLSIDKIYYK